MDVIEKIEQIGIIPVIVLNDPKKAAPLADALIRGGIPCAEITFRTREAAQVIRQMADAHPDMLIGAGTIRTTEQVDAAWEAGARFMVSPHLSDKVVTYCQSKGIPVIPGCCTPTDVGHATELGLQLVKFFPAEAAGGMKMLRSLASVYGEVRFMPTGGILEDTMAQYLKFSKVIACGGSWMVAEQLIESEDYESITRKSRQAVKRVNGLRLNLEKAAGSGKV